MQWWLTLFTVCKHGSTAFAYIIKHLTVYYKSLRLSSPFFLIYQCTSEVNAENMGTGIFNGSVISKHCRHFANHIVWFSNPCFCQ